MTKNADNMTEKQRKADKYMNMPVKNQNENGGAHGETTVRDEDRPRQAAWKNEARKGPVPY